MLNTPSNHPDVADIGNFSNWRDPFFVDRELDLPNQIAIPQYSCGSRCRWIPNPNTDWGTIIGLMYLPCETADADPQWGWVYLLRLDWDSPSRAWVSTDWVEEDQLEPLNSPVPTNDGVCQ